MPGMRSREGSKEGNGSSSYAMTTGSGSGSYDVESYGESGDAFLKGQHAPQHMSLDFSKEQAAKGKQWLARGKKRWIAITAVALVALYGLSHLGGSARIEPHYFMPENGNIDAALPSNMQEDTGLSITTCRTEFPLLYPQLDDNARAWKGRGGIKASDIADAAAHCEGGCAHLVIADEGQLYIRGTVQDWQSRIRAVLQIIQKALQSADVNERAALDGVEFVLSTADKDGFINNAGSGAGWVLDKRVVDAPGQYLIPDFSFSAWPEAGTTTYTEFRRDAARINAEMPWHEKHGKVFFRGDPNIKGRRAGLLAQLKKPDADQWSDIKRTSFWETGPDIAPIVTPADHCRHKYLLHTEGNSYSGRSKFILGCASAVIMHDLEWTQHFHPAIITDESSPDRNAVMGPGGDFDHLEELMRGMQAEDRRAATDLMLSASNAPRNWSELTRGQQVAQNANRTLTGRYLAPAATACYMRAALMSYASVIDRQSYANGRGATLRPGGGVKPGAGAGDNRGDGLKKLNLEGDVHVDTWNLLGQPQWPVR